MTPETAEKLILAGMLDGRRAFGGPWAVQLDIHHACLNRCIGCWVHSPLLNPLPDSKFGSLPAARLLPIIDELAGLGVQEIQLSGQGEPLLHPEVGRIAVRVKERGMKLNVVTSLLGAPPEALETLVRAGTDLFTVSLWAGDAETYQKTHPGGSAQAFAHVCNGLALLQTLRGNAAVPRIKHYQVLCSLNAGAIDPMLGLALRTGADFIEFQPMDPMPGITDSYALPPEARAAAAARLDALAASQAVPFDPPAGSQKPPVRLLSGVRSAHPDQAAWPELHEAARGKKRFEAADFVFSTRTETAGGRRFVQRLLTCPALRTTHPRFDNPQIAEGQNRLTFRFERADCRRCQLRGPCGPGAGGKTVAVQYLELLGLDPFRRKMGGPAASVPCRAGWAFSRVLSNGQVIPCCQGESYPAGNILELPFTKIWFSGTMDAFREKTSTLPPTHAFFKPFRCLTACDNLGLNLEFDRKLKNLNPFDREFLHSVLPQLAKAEGDAQEAAKIVSAAAPPPPGGEATPEEADARVRRIRIRNISTAPWCEHTFAVGEPGVYEAFARYSSPQARPVNVEIDGAPVRTGTMAKPAGGLLRPWGRRRKIFSLFLPRGTHRLRLIPDPPPGPRVRALDLVLNPRGTPLQADLELATEDLYPAGSAFKILLSALRRFGPGYTARKLVRYVLSGSHLDTWLVLAGVSSGRYALKGPGLVQIDLTTDCRNRCLACWLHSPLLPRQPEPRYLPLPEAERLLAELEGMRTREVLLAGGGEPMLHPDFWQVVSLVKKLKMICTVNTSLSPATPEDVRRFIDLEVDNLTVSVWAGSPESYARTHPHANPGDFARLEALLLALNTNKPGRPAVKICNVISAPNCGELEEMLDFARRTRCDAVEFVLVDVVPGATDSLALSPGQLQKLLEDCRRIQAARAATWKREVVLIGFDRFIRRVEALASGTDAPDAGILKSLKCTTGWLFARVGADGAVTPCLKGHRIPVGNLSAQTFKKIWNGARQQVFRRRALAPKPGGLLRRIGNDPACEACGCHRGCDDLGRIVHLDQKKKSLSKPERFLIYLAGRLVNTLAAFGNRRSRQNQ